MKKLSILFILLAGMLWGSLGMFVRVLNAAGIQSMDIVFLRAVVTAVSMLIYLMIVNRKMLVIHLKDVWCFLGTGIASITFFNFCYFKAVMVTSLSVAAVLLYTAPAMVMVLSFFLFHESFTRKKGFAVIMTFVGCVLVTGVFEDGQIITMQGILYGLGAGLGYALYSIFSRYALERGYHSLTITCYTFIVASVVTCFFADREKVFAVAFSDLSYTAISLALGILCTVAPYLLYTLGLTRVDNSTASIVASIEPVTATVLGILIYQEAMDVWKLLGIVMVLGAMVVCNEKKNSLETDEEE